jgi:membrane protein
MASDVDERGRRAERPREIPTPGWRDIALRVKDKIGRDHLTIVAAGVAFYALLALFPALAATVAIYGLVADPQDVEGLLARVTGAMPAEAEALLREQLEEVAGASGGALGLGALASLGIALWSATAGMKGVIEALNIAYEENERRSFIKLTLVALALTLGGIVFVLVALTLIVAIPPLLAVLPLSGVLAVVVSLARWPVLGLAAVLVLAVLYRHAPCRDVPRWRWVTPGALIAVVLWIVASIGFSWYVANFADYNATYGALGAVIILMMWLFITSFCILLGAEINAEMEHQTGRDTTRGPEEPMGERGAAMADTIGRQP